MAALKRRLAWWLRSWKPWFLQFLEAQLLITIVSMPILAYWGLPISILSPIGNLVFIPFLTGVLLISSFLFFAALFHLPCGLLGKILEVIVEVWLWLLRMGDPRFMWVIKQPPAWLVIPLSLGIAWFFLRLRQIKQDRRVILWYTLVSLIVILGSLTISDVPHKPVAHKVGTERYHLWITHHPDHTLTIDDHGFLTHNVRSDKNCLFDLMPFLAQRFGTTQIKRLSCHAVSVRSLQCLRSLCQFGSVTTLVLDTFKPLSTAGWRSFFELREYTQEQNIKLIRPHRASPRRLVVKKSLTSLVDRAHRPFQKDRRTLQQQSANVGQSVESVYAAN